MESAMSQISSRLVALAVATTLAFMGVMTDSAFAPPRLRESPRVHGLYSDSRSHVDQRRVEAARRALRATQDADYGNATNDAWSPDWELDTVELRPTVRSGRVLSDYWTPRLVQRKKRPFDSLLRPAGHVQWLIPGVPAQ